MKTKTNNFFDIMTARVEGFDTVKSVSNTFLAQGITVVGVYIVVRVLLWLIGIGNLDLMIGFMASIAATLAISLLEVYRNKRAFMQDHQ